MKDYKPNLPLSNFIHASEQSNPLFKALKTLASSPLPKTFGGLDLTQLPKMAGALEQVFKTQSDRMSGLLGTYRSPTSVFDDFLKRINVAQDFFKNSLPAQGFRLGHMFEGWDKLPQRTRDSILAMANAGWYLDLEMGMSDIARFKRVVDDEGAATAEAFMATHFEERLSGIRDSLNEKFPHRKPFFDSAFGAVERGEHLLAIPVLLMQTDGISKDVANEYFFVRARKGQARPGVADFLLKQAESDLAEAFLCMFEELRPIGLSEKEREPGFSGLNRHMVMHGEDLAYGTKVNSLKAVSLLNCVAQVLTGELRDDESEDEEVAAEPATD
ncbi:hypothetical protein HDE78_002161 [Rhodanobacter sp. K2T2]|uniref:hypothetical protein n=1 Tax=Rhodanobacter sp. K2T2 TaxID=2723085 RepID=UPI0015CAEC15|nr:hypothetical protein [Rhodanobacter sp. K2T2]NYE29203.1 hypothetical protein [Rhodanobacter sp. K2T2]